MEVINNGNDIAAGLQIPVENAEEVKKREGNALLNLMERDRNISLPSTNNGFSGKIIRAITLNTIIEARIKEIFQLVKNEIDHKLPNLTTEWRYINYRWWIIFKWCS